MVTLDALIAHLTNIRDYYEAGDLPVTVTVDRDTDVEFVRLESMSQIDSFEVVDCSGNLVRGVFLDPCNLLEITNFKKDD